MAENAHPHYVGADLTRGDTLPLQAYLAQDPLAQYHFATELLVAEFLGTRAFPSRRFRKSTANRGNPGTKTEVSHG